jgi:hypothetical protein
MRWRAGPWTWWALSALAAAGVAAAVVVATGGSETSTRPAPEPRGPAPPEEGEGGTQPAPDEGGADPAREPPPLDEATLSAPQRQAARAVRDYVEGLDARDGEVVCELLAPGAIEAVDLPRRRGECARSLRASIGYRDPRGLPVWETASVRGLLTVAVDGDRASVTVTTVTRFADRDQPSIEDDVIHLRRQGGRWVIVKPSATLYRAVGIADVPPRVLAPPE